MDESSGFGDFSIGKTSKFNEGILQTGRMNDLQTTIHTARLRPLQFFQMDEFGQGLFGYEIMMNAADGHFVEVYPKLSKEEEKNARELRKKVKEFLKTNPIHEIKYNEAGGWRKKKVANLKNWEKFEDILFEYEIMMRRLYDKHKMSSPEEDDSDLF